MNARNEVSDGHTERACFEHAIRSALFRHAGSPLPVTVLLILTSTVPLYLMNYHQGAIPLLGWFLSFLLGGIAGGAALCNETSRKMALTYKALLFEDAVKRGVLCALLVGLPLAVYSWVVQGFEAVNEHEVYQLFTNNWGSAWKPIAHVVAIGVMVILIRPSGVIDTIATGWWGEIERFYSLPISKRRLFVYMILLMSLSFIPVLGLISLPIAARLMSNLAGNASPGSNEEEIVHH